MPNRDPPLEFPYIGIFAQDLTRVASSPFVVIAMMTSGYATKAKRLVESCRRFGLSHAVYEVPTVHRSISVHGGQDHQFTKANFIYNMLEKLEKSVLYVDADVYFASYPRAVDTIAASECDFGIYNWLADEHTEAYKPIEVNLGTQHAPNVIRNRFYVFSHSVDYLCTDQLICSGAVQYYANTGSAKKLLRWWQRIVERFDLVPDDRCLDYAYNNFASNDSKPRAVWFDKSYARYAFWIHIKPVINHPEWPYKGKGFRSIEDYTNTKRFYPERAQLKNVEYVFPKDCVIDVELKLLSRLSDEQLIPFARIDRPLWITRDADV